VEREIWFQRVLWSYVPCHWKGFAVLAACVFVILFGGFAGQSAFDAFGYRDLDWLPFPIFFFPLWIAVMTIAKRHSE